MIFIGIDPGQKGGFVTLDIDGRMISAAGFDRSPKSRLAQEFDFPHGAHDCRIYLEEVSAMPGQGVVSMFTFGKEYGRIIGTLDTLGKTYTRVRPQKWQKILGPFPPGTSKEAARTFAIGRVGEDALIPAGCRTPHSGIVDAYCIAEYGRQIELGLIDRPKDRPKDRPNKKPKAKILRLKHG